MHLTDLASPGALPNAMKLRSEAFRAIGYVGVMSDLSKGTSDSPAALAAFFEDCAEHVRKSIPKPAKAATKETS